ncbi:MAG TPA: membrane dipeptidase, partial [Pyrinomonadaceae bacterium]|nr:membrane dipeptidase [Pyrinomonadaceae bacterium]
NSLGAREGIVNCLGAPWPEDLSPAFIDQLRVQGVRIVGCTANLTWDDTLDSIENFEQVKSVVRDHPHAYLVRSSADLDRDENRDKLGVLLGLQNPKALSDSLSLINAFFDLGLRCLSLAFNENSYYGCGYASEVDTGLTLLGKKAITRMNELGIVIDLSHSGDRTAMEALDCSDQPVIFSHSTSRTLFNRRRGAPDSLIVAAAKKYGVICQDVRANTSVAEYSDWVEYCVKLVGIDHVGVSAQDDWHRSYKDTKRIAPYLPSFAAEFQQRDWSEDRIYRRDGIGAKLLDDENLAADLKARNYSDEAIDKVLGGNMMRVLRTVLPCT